jgi:hypothetical protein
MTPAETRTIKDAMDCLDELTEWENEFILSLADIDPFCTLTDKQKECLERIADKI